MQTVWLPVIRIDHLLIAVMVDCYENTCTFFLFVKDAPGNVNKPTLSAYIVGTLLHQLSFLLPSIAKYPFLLSRYFTSL